jgi:DnaJ-class molecular chaperone
MERNQFCSTKIPNHICPQCNGSKKMITISFNQVLWEEEELIENCDICNGTGKIDSATLEQIMTPPKSNNLNMEDIPF